MQTIAIDTPQLGNRSYLVHDGEHALVVDPPRDVERIEEAAEDAGVRILTVAETHVHNDYVSGGRRLARRHRADHVTAAAEPLRFARTGVHDGDELQVGALQVEVLATPGHTPGHLAFVVTTDAGSPALFSGGSLLFGTVGRTDLTGHELTEPLARAQVRSARRLAQLLPAETALHPTHGFGSFCAAAAADTASHSTLGAELGRNPVLDGRDEETVAHELLAGFGPVPRYYAHMAELNRNQDLSPPPQPRRLQREQLLACLQRGVPVVDVRTRESFARGHLDGVTSIAYGVQCATYVGWLLPWGTPPVLVGDEEDLQKVVEDLRRIGIDHVEGVSTEATPERGATCGYRRLPWEALAEEQRGGRRPLVVDVRTRAEFGEGHVTGAVNIPVHELPEVVDDLPAGEAWVHCKSGYRAGIGASMLHAAGRPVVHLDDDWDRAASAGIELEVPPRP